MKIFIISLILISTPLYAEKIWSPVKKIVSNQLHQTAIKYGQCIESLTEDVLFNETCDRGVFDCKSYPHLNYKTCLKQGLKCLSSNDEKFLDKNLLAKVKGYDQEGVEDCLFYDGTDIIKRPHPDHLAAIKKHKDKINKLGKELGISPAAIACTIGADATVTRNLWPDQKSLSHYMIQAQASRKAQAYLTENNTSFTPTDPNDRSEDAIINLTGIILKEGEIAYGKYGHKLANKPEILATLYNIGARKTVYGPGSNEPILVSRAKGRGPNYSPSPNFFGLFCKRYEKLYENILK